MNNVKIENNGLLKIKFNNGFSCENIIKTIIESYDKHKPNKILIEMKQDCSCKVSDVLKQYDAGDALAKNFYGKGVQIAILSECKTFSRFTEAIARNRGLFIEISNSENTITDWL